MYSPISDSSLSQKQHSNDRKWSKEQRLRDKLELKEQTRESRSKNQSDHKTRTASPEHIKKHKKKGCHHSKDRKSEKHRHEKNRTSSKESRMRDYDKPREKSRHRRSRSRSREQSNPLYRYRNTNLQESSSLKSVIGQSSFIGEMLRNTKTKKFIDSVEGSKLLESLAESKEKKQAKEREEGEILTDEEDRKSSPPALVDDKIDYGSFTPPLHLLRLSSFKLPTTGVKTEPIAQQDIEPEFMYENANELTAKTHPKKKNVLDLPMPPISFHRPVFKRHSADIEQALSSSRLPETPEFKPDLFTQPEAHFTEMCKHLNVNPVVISPNETYSEPFQAAPPRRRPTILNRKQPIVDITDRLFNSYEIIQQVGEGTYGKVFKAKDLQNNQLVAMKFVLMDNENEGFPITGLREINILRELQHPNIIKLHQIVNDEQNPRRQGTYLVFEYMNHDLMGLLDNEAMVFDEITIYRIFRQILEGLNYCHQRLILHRDLKCSNILMNNKGEIKLADFGLGRQWVAERPYTNKVISLWYRPIELLLGEEKYGPSVDVWSLGCIFGELFQRRPVFPFGTAIEIVNAIFTLCGTPSKNSWPEVKYLPGFKTLKPKTCRRTLMDAFNRTIPSLALDLFNNMLCLNPAKRITAEEALKSNWILIMSEKKLVEPLKLPTERDCHEMSAKIRRKKQSMSKNC